MDHATIFYSEPKTLKIPEFYTHEVAKLVFHYHLQPLASLLPNLFSKINQVSQKSTQLSSTANNPTLYIHSSLQNNQTSKKYQVPKC